MQIRIFDVEHGGCALVTTDNGAHLLIDSGHNTTTNWRPSKYLQNHRISYLDALMITNYDEDHASDLANLREAVQIGMLISNPSVSSSQLLQLKELGGIGNGIRSLVEMKGSFTGGGAQFPDPSIRLSYFWNRYPDEFEDENNLSLVAILKAHGLTICFPGDMERAGWRNLLRNRNGFAQAIAEVNVFVASHHGRANGCCEELYEEAGLFPTVTIISDSGIQYASQDTIAWYRARTAGFNFYGNFRRVLTTRRDGRILLDVDQYGIRVDTF